MDYLINTAFIFGTMGAAFISYLPLRVTVAGLLISVYGVVTYIRGLDAGIAIMKQKELSK